MSSYDVLTKLATSWSGLRPTLVLVLATLLVRWLLPAETKRRARVPLAMAIGAVALRLAASSMRMGQMWAVWGVLNIGVRLLVVLAAIGLVALVLYDLVLLRFRVAVPSVLRDFSQIIVAALVIAAFLYQQGIDPFAAVTTSAVLAGVVGLALQSTIANVFGGLYLPLDRTVGIGDWIKVGDHIGQITEVNWRATRIVTKQGDTVFIPNGELIGTQVLNFSKPTGLHRMEIVIGFDYRHPPNVVRRAMLDAIVGAPDVMTTPAPDCLVAEFAESGVNYLVRYWIEDFGRDLPIDSEVRARLWYAAQRAGLEIPFPIQQFQLRSGDASDLVAAARRVLDRTDLFAALDAAERDLLASGMRRTLHARGETVIRQGDCGDAVYVIEEGRVGVGIVHNGIGREIAVLGPGDVFGEMGLLTDDPRRASCFAQTDLTCWIIDHAALRTLIGAHPAVAERLAATVAKRQVETSAQEERLSVEARNRKTVELSERLLIAARRLFGLDDSGQRYQA